MILSNRRKNGGSLERRCSIWDPVDLHKRCLPGVMVNAALALVPLATACSTKLADRPMSLGAQRKRMNGLGGREEGEGEERGT